MFNLPFTGVVSVSLYQAQSGITTGYHLERKIDHSDINLYSFAMYKFTFHYMNRIQYDIRSFTISYPKS